MFVRFTCVVLGFLCLLCARDVSVLCVCVVFLRCVLLCLCALCGCMVFFEQCVVFVC